MHLEQLSMATLLQSQQPVPDLVIAFSTISCLQLYSAFYRNVVFARLPTYKRLSFRDRYDWDRRFTNISFQALQLFFNLYILFIDRNARSDAIYGYSRFTHVGFVIILSFYIHDTTGMLFHPRAPSGTFTWVIHHIVSSGLLVYNVSYKRSSSFPAAAFLISAAGHIPNELRWFFTAVGVFERSSMTFRDMFNILSTCFISFVFLVPPIWLLFRCAEQLNLSLYALLTNRMTPYCNFFFALIYFTHVVVIVLLCQRSAREWRTQPPKFRHSKQQ